MTGLDQFADFEIHEHLPLSEGRMASIGTLISEVSWRQGQSWYATRVKYFYKCNDDGENRITSEKSESSIEAKTWFPNIPQGNLVHCPGVDCATCLRFSVKIFSLSGLCLRSKV